MFKFLGDKNSIVGACLVFAFHFVFAFVLLVLSSMSGWANNGLQYGIGTSGNYWSSTWVSGDSMRGREMKIDSRSNVGYSRYGGESVRCVLGD